MVRLVSFFRLHSAERSLLVRSALTLAAIELALRLLQFGTLRRLLDSIKRRSPERASSMAREPIVCAVARASQFVPGARNCLVRAMAAELMLTRAGYTSELKFGAAKNASGQFAAHAWLESEGVALIGNLAAGEYEPFESPRTAAAPET